MASALVKRPCTKCDKGAGVTTCDGCQQSFCIKHIIEHRQELAVNLDTIGQDHDLFRRDLTLENLAHPMLIRINEWEQKSITKIQVAAEAARADLRQLIDATTNEIKMSADKITHEMHLCREQDDYTENDLLRWTQALKDLQKLLDTQLTIEIVENENTETAIHIIKVRSQKPSFTSTICEEAASTMNDIPTPEIVPTITHEKFSSYFGNVVISDDGLLATCVGVYWDGSNVFGAHHYTSGKHEIHFRIEHKGTNNVLFGITTATRPMPVQTLTSPYVYGWWEVDQAIESVKGHRVHTDRTVRAGDEVTMTLDCDNRQILFQHHRTNMLAHLPVDLEKCPFPWKLLVTLRTTGDSIRIFL